MKALTYISGLALLVLSSCSSGLYMSREYDDLYYTSSDRQAEGTTVVVKNRPVERDLRAEEYYDNIYAADTLVSEEYAVAAGDGSEAQGGSIINNYYYDDSYSGRLRRFYGNYFDPYWRDPFYYSFSPFSYSYGSWGYPYSYGYYDPFYYDSYYYDPFYYGGFSRYGYYGSFYPYYYSSFYSPFYNRYYGYYYNDEVTNVSYGRRERSSTLSSRYNNSVSGGVSGVSRRETYLSGDASKTQGEVTKSTLQTTPVNRRSVSSDINRATSGTGRAVETQNPVRQSTGTSSETGARRVAVERPEYNSTNRSYTPSYTNPRTSTRPSYNNTRVGTGSNSSGNTRIMQTPSGVRSGSSSYSAPRSGSSSYSAPRSGSSGVYSVPSRSGSSSSSGSRSYSSPGSRSSSYSSGSSSSGSYSGGSSSSSSSGSSRSSGSSSGGRR